MVVLATKVYVAGEARDRALDGLRSMVADVAADLDVETTVGVREDGFPSVTVEGPDAVVVRNALDERFGTLVPDAPGVDGGGADGTDAGPGTGTGVDGDPDPDPDSAADADTDAGPDAARGTDDSPTVGAGTLAAWDDRGWTLDVGFGNRVRVPAAGLGLGPGDPGQVRERFGLVQHTPVRYAVEDGRVRLADAERDRLYDWRRGSGRVNVNSATRSEVRATLNRAGHVGDYVTVERLGVLEQSVVVADGTDPPGLLASVGQYLRSEMLAVLPG